MPPTPAATTSRRLPPVVVWNVLSTILQVAGLAVIGLGLWLLSPLLGIGAVLVALGYVAAPDR